jgi:hypothetical protein
MDERQGLSPVRQQHDLHRSSGSLAPARQRQPPGSTLSAHGGWISQRVSGHGEVTLGELCVERAERGVEAHRLHPHL